MAADLRSCKSFTWATSRTKGCEGAFRVQRRLKQHGLALVGHLIYLIGGDTYRTQRGVFALNTNTLSWRCVLDTVEVAAAGQQPALIGDKLYSFGRPVRTHLNAAVLCFDVLLEQVEVCPCETPWEVPFDGYAGEYIETLGLVVLYGGVNRLGNAVSERIMGFNVTTYAWDEIEVKGGNPPPRRNHASCLHGKSDLFFSGGNADTSNWPSGEIFHLDCSGGRFVWSEVTWSISPLARANSTMCCVGHRVYIYGGYPTNGIIACDNLYIYDLQDETGVEFSAASTHQSGDYRLSGNIDQNTLHEAVAMNTKIIVLGGRTPAANMAMILSPQAD